MSKLQAMRQERQYSQQEIAAVLQAAGQRIDVSLLSKMENDLCLPTPPTAQVLCNMLDCSLDAIYRPDELDFGLVTEGTKISPREGRKRQESRTERKMQFRLTEYALQVFTSDVLAVCGYRNKTEWFYECVRQLEERYLKIKEKAARSAGTETDGKQVNKCTQAMFTSNIAQDKEVCQDG